MAKFLSIQILLSNAATAAIVLGWVTPSQAMCWTMFQLLLGASPTQSIRLSRWRGVCIVHIPFSFLPLLVGHSALRTGVSSKEVV